MLRRTLLVLVAMMAAIAGLTAGLLISAGTAAAESASFTYDVRTIANSAIDAIADSDASTDQLSGVTEGSASPSVEFHGTSTTPGLRSVATNRFCDRWATTWNAC